MALEIMDVSRVLNWRFAGACGAGGAAAAGGGGRGLLEKCYVMGVKAKWKG